MCMQPHSSFFAQHYTNFLKVPFFYNGAFTTIYLSNKDAAFLAMMTLRGKQGNVAEDARSCASRHRYEREFGVYYYNHLQFIEL